MHRAHGLTLGLLLLLASGCPSKGGQEKGGSAGTSGGGLNPTVTVNPATAPKDHSTCLEATCGQYKLKPDTADDRLMDSGDWAPKFLKGECGPQAFAFGVSKVAGHPIGPARIHEVLCKVGPEGRYPHKECRPVTFDSGDDRGNSGVQPDWSPHHYKGECNTDEYVAGVSQGPGGRAHSLLCCKGQVAHKACTPHSTQDDSREVPTFGDWDPGYIKVQCDAEQGRYLAGLSLDPASGNLAEVLCCKAE